jgi:hypothetical protein
MILEKAVCHDLQEFIRASAFHKSCAEAFDLPCSSVVTTAVFLGPSAFVSITVARQQGNRTPFRFLIPP